MSLDQRARTASEDLLRVSERQVDTETWLRDLPWLRRRRDLTRIVATSAVVALVVGGGWFASLQLGVTAQQVPPTEQTDVGPEDPAESFMQAWASGDAEGVMDLLTPGGRVDGYEVAQVPALLDWSRALGQRYQFYQCSHPTPGDTECMYTMEDDIVRAAGLSGRSGFGGLAVLSFDGDKIDVAEDVVRLPGNDGIGQPFMTWLRDTHPNDVDLMLDSDDRPRLSPTSIRLWRFHTEEFVRSDGILVRAQQIRINQICAAAMPGGAGPGRWVAGGTATWADRGSRLESAVAQMRALPPIGRYQPMFDQLYTLLDERAAEVGLWASEDGFWDESDPNLGDEIWTAAPWLNGACISARLR